MVMAFLRADFELNNKLVPKFKVVVSPCLLHPHW